jgi:hypothetical protein
MEHGIAAHSARGPDADHTGKFDASLLPGGIVKKNCSCPCHLMIPFVS